jgi:hypothetical protein
MASKIRTSGLLGRGSSLLSSGLLLLAGSSLLGSGLLRGGGLLSRSLLGSGLLGGSVLLASSGLSLTVSNIVGRIGLPWE